MTDGLSKPLRWWWPSLLSLFFNNDILIKHVIKYFKTELVFRYILQSVQNAQNDNVENGTCVSLPFCLSGLLPSIRPRDPEEDWWVCQ